MSTLLTVDNLGIQFGGLKAAKATERDMWMSSPTGKRTEMSAPHWMWLQKPTKTNTNNENILDSYGLGSSVCAALCRIHI